jgi:hypothetical protein
MSSIDNESDFSLGYPAVLLAALASTLPTAVTIQPSLRSIDAAGSRPSRGITSRDPQSAGGVEKSRMSETRPLFSPTRRAPWLTGAALCPARTGGAAALDSGAPLWRGPEGLTALLLAAVRVERAARLVKAASGFRTAS